MDKVHELLLIQIDFMKVWGDALIDGDLDKADLYRKKVYAIQDEIDGLQHELENMVMAYDPTW